MATEQPAFASAATVATPQRPAPTELDNEVLLIFAALFEKSQSPQNYLWQLQQFYRETRDFRLLACLADAVVGPTAGQVYPLLQDHCRRFSARSTTRPPPTRWSNSFPRSVGRKKGTVPICRNGPKGAAHKWGLSPFSCGRRRPT